MKAAFDGRTFESADVVITGEGRLDTQSTLGKGAVTVAERARARGVAALAVCGVIALDDPDLRPLRDQIKKFAAGDDERT